MAAINNTSKSSGWRVEDIKRLRWVFDIHVDTTGQRVVVAIRNISMDDEGYETRLALLDLKTDALQYLTPAGWHPSLPRWSPDNRFIAFSADNGEETAIWVLNPDTDDQPSLVTKCEGGVSELTWSPDGNRIAYVTRLAVPDDPFIDPSHPAPSGISIIRRLNYKTDREGYWDGRWNHIVILSMPDDAFGIGHPGLATKSTQVTSGPYDHQHVSWSPCGRSVAFVANRTSDWDITENRDVWLAELHEDTSQLKQLTSLGGPASRPSWSPDGTRVAFLGHDRSAEAATNTQLWVVSVTAPKDVRCLTRDFDRSIEDCIIGDATVNVPQTAPAWHPKGRRIWVLATDGGSTHVFSIATDQTSSNYPAAPDIELALGVRSTLPEENTSVTREISGQRHILRFVPSVDFRKIFLIVSTPNVPSDVWLWQKGKERRLTDINHALLGERVLNEPDRLLFDVEDGIKIEGWLTHPQNPQEKPHPLIVHVHRGRFGNTFGIEFQLLASAGFAVLYVNCRGGYGYGQAFRAAIHYAPLTAECRDILAAVKTVIDRPDIDESRVGVTGTSYGGKLTTWFLATTNLFRAGISRASISNQYSNWGSNDRGYLRWAPVGTPWDFADFYLQASPITLVDRISAPLLLLHGDADFRCSLEQSEQLYTALKYLGCPTELVIFHGQSHNLEHSGTPKLRYEFYSRILAWFEEHISQN